ncbi:MAG: hypothetical protein MI919_02055, partial [Holophagales bacterium]|nr:hypothetical protein [Holophagales bacterium]
DPDRRDIGRYVRDLQTCLILTLGELGVEAHRREGKDYIGVWVGEAKIASLGVHLSRWIAIHGFSLNVSARLEHFSGIVACGLPEVAMTSVEGVLGQTPPLRELAASFAHIFGRVFDRTLESQDAAELLGLEDAAIAGVRSSSQPTSKGQGGGRPS